MESLAEKSRAQNHTLVEQRATCQEMSVVESRFECTVSLIRVITKVVCFAKSMQML